MDRFFGIGVSAGGCQSRLPCLHGTLSIRGRIQNGDRIRDHNFDNLLEGYYVGIHGMPWSFTRLCSLRGRPMTNPCLGL